jgi:hypothetical protein
MVWFGNIYYQSFHFPVRILPATLPASMGVESTERWAHKNAHLENIIEAKKILTVFSIFNCVICSLLLFDGWNFFISQITLFA